jgi:hypothetical protein
MVRVADSCGLRFEMEPHLLLFIARARSESVADVNRSERNAMSEDTKEIKISKLSRRNFLGVGTTFLAAATGMAGLTASAQALRSTKEEGCGQTASNPEPEDKSLLRGGDESKTPPVDIKGVLEGLQC